MPSSAEFSAAPATNRLADENFDLLVIGGGITGAALAWLGTISGRSVALVERADFASGASAASQKIIHSGLRYLQHLDVVRCARSIDDRRRLARLAPHLVGRLKCALPLYGATSPAVAGTLVYRALLKMRGAANDIGAPRVVGPGEILAQVPEIAAEGLRGAIVWDDGAVYDTERLVVAFARSAAERGAVIANHVEAVDARSRVGHVETVQVRRRDDGAVFEVKARQVVDCSGQWRFLSAKRSRDHAGFVAGMNVVTAPLSATSMAFGVPGSGRAAWFVTPWQGHSIIGTHWYHAAAGLDDGHWSREELERFLRDFNRDFSGRDVSIDDVLDVHCAQVPARAGAAPGGGRATLERTRIIDHAADGMSGAFSVLATKYTTCLSTAALVLARLPGGFSMPPCDALPPLVGGDVDDWSDFRRRSLADGVPDDLLRAYGSEAPALATGGDVLRRRVRHAVEREMATTLRDALVRRLGLSPARVPQTVAEAACQEMADVLGWDAGERHRQVEQLYRPFEVR